MKYLIKIPLPICGLALGMVALGNLLSSYSEILKNICIIISTIIILLVTIKLFLDEDIKKQLDQVAIASVFVTYFMSIVLLAPTFQKLNIPLGYFLWYFGTIGHLIYLVYFTKKFAFPFTLDKVLPSWFIVYVGYVASANTSLIFGYGYISKYLIYAGLIMFILIFILTTYRYIKGKEMPDGIKPFVVIYSAPINLCIVGYLTIISPINYSLFKIMLVVSLLIFGFVLLQIPKIFKKGFFPSYAALTFPLVISIIAYKLSFMVLFPDILIIIRVLEIFVCVIVLYVLYKYIRFILE